MKYYKAHCKSCGLQVLDHEEACIRCGSSDIIRLEYKIVLAPPRISLSIDAMFAGADDVEVTDIKCWQCSDKRDHVLCFPILRDRKDYNKTERLTALAYCPTRIWQHSKSSRKGKEEFIKKALL